MKTFLVFCGVLSAALAGVVDYNQAAPQAGGYGNDYQKTETKCTPYYDTVNTDHCEAYTERVCTTTNKESCKDVPDKSCRAVVSSKQNRKCFDVTEERCSLVEDVQFETIQVPSVVQKCHKVNERVCDTVYEAEASATERQQCINVENSRCTNEDKVIYDVTCRTTTNFECETYQDDGYGGYGEGQAAGAAAGGYGQEAGYGKQDAYAAPKSYCKRTQDTKCYKTPRTVSTQKCAPYTERVCESLRIASPFAQPKLSCRNEEKKVCELEERNQAKQVRKYVYTKKCQPVPRSVCENADEKTLVPSCVGATRKECTYSPVEQCTDEPKKHCYQVQHRVQKQKCETYKVDPAGYQAPAAAAPEQPSYQKYQK